MHRVTWPILAKGAVAVAMMAIAGAVYFNALNTSVLEKAVKTQLSNPDSSVHQVLLTEDGFEPNELIIRQNDTVVFSTENGVNFWPASNFHPQHSTYPEFDPKEPIAPLESWQFHFTKAGRFKYHDHLFANYTGLIVALSPQEERTGESNAPTTDINACAKFVKIEEKQQCWDEQLEAVLDTNGIDVAFDYFLKLYNTEPGIPKECHGWGHTLGKAAYDIYKNGEALNLKPETAYCGYGYFHGFIGALIKDTGRVQETREFCEYAEKELEGVRSVKENCIHGVGHGTTAMLLEEGGYDTSEFLTTAQKGVGICELIYTQTDDLENCYDGVFNELHLELFNNNYGMNFDAYMASSNNDPFLYCKQQQERHKLACFYELSGMFWKIFNHDVVASTKYALENTEDLAKRGEKVIAKIAADQIQFDIVKETHEKSIDACRIVPEFLFVACFEGILNGFIQHGEPGNAHIKGYAFCNETYLNETEEEQCYFGLTRILQWVYSSEEFKKSCQYIQYDPRAPQCQPIKT